MKTSAVYFAVLVTLILMGCARKSPPADPVLAGLRAKMDAAITQGDMNTISYEIFQHLDTKLSALEDRIREDLHNEEWENNFDKAASLWREYREAHAAFAANGYEGGSIRPLILNDTKSGLTEERIAGLIDAVGPEILYWEDGKGGWSRKPPGRR
jgi:uncharacterized protein YecT (DUF1311 family)